MILVQLHGGLGNQMFQAAAGLVLAARLSVPLAFDLSRYRQGGLRGFALAPFALDASIRSEPPLASLLRYWNRLRGDKLRPPGFVGTIHREPHFHYDPGFDDLRAPVMLAGYFQSPRYFAGHEAQIAQAFAPEKLAGAEALVMAGALAGEDTVAIHLRRGDYVSDQAAAATHAVLGWDYYDRAVAMLSARIVRPRIFIFSDDPEAAAEAAGRWPGAQAMAGKSAGDDLFLMSRCRHHVIANSSFSWWSCWLDRREGGIRIRPQQWFGSASLARTDDLCPPDWLAL